jgi:hypothetical protein
MRIMHFLAAVVFFTAAACKKNGENEDAYVKTLLFDVKNHEVIMGMKKVHNLTDSFYFEFNTKDASFNCDQYRINAAELNEAKKLTITLGNIYQEPGQCVYGSFPATFRYKSPKLPVGLYRIVVKKSNVDFDGELNVTENGYFFDWVHDEHAMKIDPKSFPR